jgi:hypothetical protein
VYPNETTVSGPDALEIVAGAKRRLADDGCQVGALRDPTGGCGGVWPGSRGPMHTGARTEARLTNSRRSLTLHPIGEAPELVIVTEPGIGCQLRHFVGPCCDLIGL